MTTEKNFDVVIIGGSYSGLSAAMSLGRALRNTLVIDSGKPCNASAPHSHNFLTRDGSSPKEIAEIGRSQLEQYQTLRFYKGLATAAEPREKGFDIVTETGDRFQAAKIIFATGLKDIMPDIDGFAECWGKSIVHCPYCHGYEIRNVNTGILANGDAGFEYARMISNWTRQLTLYTNGKSSLSSIQAATLEKHGIKIMQAEFEKVRHEKGQIRSIVFKDGSTASMEALYAKPSFEQHCPLPAGLGCEITESGHIKVDMFQKTTVAGVFACGDNSVLFRSVSGSVASGTMAGAVCSKELIEQEF